MKNFEEQWYYLQIIGFAKVDYDYWHEQARFRKHQRDSKNVERLFTDNQIWKPQSDWNPPEDVRRRMAILSYYHEPILPKRDRKIKIQAPKLCVRCHRKKDLEREHIIALKDGGKDEASNLQWMCRTCHDYKHAREKVLWAIEYERKNTWRERMWKYRLEALDRLNPITAEEFHSYWEDPKTHWDHWNETEGKKMAEEKKMAGQEKLEQFTPRLSKP